jgi:hypothetical protein
LLSPKPLSIGLRLWLRVRFIFGHLIIYRFQAAL